MDYPESGLDLAAEARRKVFEQAGDDVGVIVASHPPIKGYLSGYFSMHHDLNPRYLSAVVAGRETAALVVSAADAGPAVEALGDPALVHRYGFFCFEAAGPADPQGYDGPGSPGFEEAVVAALAATAPAGTVIGVDRSNGDGLWTLIREARGVDRVVDVTRAIGEARKTKLDGEVARIAKATKLVEEGIQAVVAEAAVGMTELEAASLIAACMVRGGGNPRLISVTSGPRSALADCYPKSRKVEPGDLLRIDAGCVVQGYTSDMARTLVFGEPDRLQATRYNAIRVGLEEELQMIRAGASTRRIFEDTVGIVRRSGIPTYRRQHVGHGIGLAGSYDFPLLAPGSDATLEAGMCLCVETPYYVLGWGGMMVEDTIRVTETGYEPITTIPRDMVSVG
ncbi:Xaa-Pro aminopeptidase [Tistlia consotensis]|uniref:Xaa-Pro aminopeptidase n=1 Tax=Tistlia consotensis USBA 355 TaxID=560819 RepID=A0A1Y6C604_9PROT|nr:Xaa-Pro peptidase family protein [Tistlia consotensis]SMF47520.1 Xaa-Pro aminopeptidase [Tistlia consotensis USBA 355]SNR82371.1 Xaa-Pro aminopeptidase [Tistlia consotensis]